MIEETTRRFDSGVLRRAIEGGDPGLLLDFYAEDAELRILNGEDLESPAFEVRGRAEIERYLRAVCDQQTICLTEGDVVFGEGSITLGQRCVYPDGTEISVKTTLEIAGGLIERQTEVARRSSG